MEITIIPDVSSFYLEMSGSDEKKHSKDMVCGADQRCVSFQGQNSYFLLGECLD